MVVMPYRRLVLAAVAAGLLLRPAPADAQRPQQDRKQQEKVDEARRQEFLALARLVDEVMAGAPAPADFAIAWRNDSLKAQEGRTYVPFILTIDPAQLPPQPVALYLRVAPRGATAPTTESKEGRREGRDERKEKAEKAAPVVYPFEDAHFIELKAPPQGQFYRISRAFAVSAGEYDVYVAVRTQLPPGAKPDTARKTAVLKQPVTVPDYWSNELTTSSIIVAEKVEQLSQPLSDGERIERPYAFGNIEVTPASQLKFTKKDSLSLIFLVYNPSLNEAGKPDLEVQYNFHQKTAEGEKFFNRTAPQLFNAQTLPPQFDVRAGHQVLAGQEIPLATFPEGEFRLEIKVTDKLSGKSITRDVVFTVAS